MVGAISRSVAGSHLRSRVAPCRPSVRLAANACLPVRRMGGRRLGSKGKTSTVREVPSSRSSATASPVAGVFRMPSTQHPSRDRSRAGRRCVRHRPPQGRGGLAACDSRQDSDNSNEHLAATASSEGDLANVPVEQRSTARIELVEETTPKPPDHACCAKAEPGSDPGDLLRHLVIAGKVDRRASTAISRM